MKDKFKGFTRPTYTISPNQIFDELLDILNGSELKVLLYIIRRTFGFKKESDNVSLNQIVNGIKKKDGSMQDYGTGLSKRSVQKAIIKLVEKNVILKTRRKDDIGKELSPTYSLNFIDIPFKNVTGSFIGFTIPNYTIVADEVFDVLLSKLSGSEIKTLLFIIRQTFGYSKESENISLNRMLHGYISKDKIVVDRGVGLQKKTLIKTLKSLIKKKIIIKEKRYSKDKGFEPTNYKINFQTDPWGKKYHLVGVKSTTPMVKKVLPPLEEKRPSPLVEKLPPQYKNKQYKKIQQHVDVISKNREEKEALNNLVDLNVNKKIAKSLIKKHSYKKINTYIKYLNYKLDKGFKPKDSIAAFLVDSIVNSYILPENFKKSEESEIKNINRAKKCYESIKGDCIASKTINLYPYCPYCEKISKKY